MKYSFATIFSLLIVGAVLTTASNLFLVLNESVGYINGLRIDYLMPKVYLSDFFMVLAIILGAVQKNFFTKLKKLLTQNKAVVITAGLLFLTSVVVGTHFLAAVIGIIKIMEFSLFVFVLWTYRKLLHGNFLLNSMYIALIVQTTFAVVQFWHQQSVTPYWLFGETQFNSSTIGIARATLFAQEKILAYGTTAHPNILAGFTVLFSLLALQLDRHKNIIKNIFIFANVLLIIFLTQSVTALLAVCIGLTVVLLPKTVLAETSMKKNIFIIGITAFFLIPLLNWLTVSVLVNNSSIFRRHQLNLSALTMFFEHPIAGVGIGNFTANLETYLQNKELVRFIQPPHHIGIVWITETGLLGATLVAQLFLKVRPLLRHASLLLLVLLPIAGLDHYLMTIQTGTLMLVFYSFLISQSIHS